MRLTALPLVALVVALVSPAAAAPEGQITWGIHITLAPIWFDPADHPGQITPYMMLYGLHDAMLRATPRDLAAPGLAESWTMSRDGLVYEFVLRRNVRFHNGDSLTAEDVKFSFERYRGASGKMLKERVTAVETPDPHRVRFVLKAPWPDFLTFYASASGAGWIVPKKYVEKVGDEGFKKAPVGAGPYKFVSFTPGVEVVLDAFDQYWRKTPSVKRLVFRTIPDESTRLAALKRGEVDVIFAINGKLAEEVQRTPGLILKPVVPQGGMWINMLDQWDAKSPWHDVRVRQAANYAVDKKAIDDAITLGFSRLSNSIIPTQYEFYWQPPIHPFDPARARRLLAEAGYPSGLDAGEYFTDGSSFVGSVHEAAHNYLAQVGIRSKFRTMERAAHFKAFGEKTLKNLSHFGSGAFGNAATRLEAFAVGGGTYAYGSYPDIDGLFREQAGELDRRRRETLLHKIQQLVHDKAMFVPIGQLAFITAHGPRLEESGLGLIPGHTYSAPYEDLKLKPSAK
jgi:peptide/nickel transport system substrate-binding protein